MTGNRGSRRDQVVRAVVEIAGTQGIRKVTHRNVDAAAGVPTGTAANYFPKIDALVAAPLELLAADAVRYSAALQLVEREYLIDLVALLVETSIESTRTETVARHAIQHELLHASEDVRAQRYSIAHKWYQAFTELIGRVNPDSPDPLRAARWILSCADGIIIDQIQVPDGNFVARVAVEPLVTHVLTEGQAGRATPV